MAFLAIVISRDVGTETLRLGVGASRLGAFGFADARYRDAIHPSKRPSGVETLLHPDAFSSKIIAFSPRLSWVTIGFFVDGPARRFTTEPVTNRIFGGADNVSVLVTATAFSGSTKTSGETKALGVSKPAFQINPTLQKVNKMRV